MFGSFCSSIELAVKIVLLDEARAQFEAEAAWWEENRDAKALFIDEFARAVEQVGSLPETGQRYRQARGKPIRRVLMKKTGCHVYYFHDHGSNLVEIHSVWGSRRRRGPKL